MRQFFPLDPYFILPIQKETKRCSVPSSKKCAIFIYSAHENAISTDAPTPFHIIIRKDTEKSVYEAKSR